MNSNERLLNLALKMDDSLLKEFLEEKYLYYNNPEFIENDPISVPHSFSELKDIEIAAFFSATLAWGQRNTIIKNAFHLMRLMNNSPYEFIVNSEKKDMVVFQNFKHRTFNATDSMGFVLSLKKIYLNFGSLKNLFENLYAKSGNIKDTLTGFRKEFLESPIEERTKKHISDVSKNASAKRLNMFLRWMVRYDNRGVDFGIWKSIPASALYIPIDVHTGNIARKLGLLKRKQNDWKAVEELTARLKEFDPADPVKYDYALFGIGVSKDF